MSIAGIVAEFNPFHNGHKHLIDCAKNDGHKVFCVISGNFVQRGDTSVISKFERARQALLSGADLIAELPCPWSMSTAQNFAIGAISQLNAIGIDILYFGSECGDLDALIKVSDILISKQFSNILKEKLQSGKTFANIRQEALSEIDASLSRILNGPNDTLAVEYISAARKINPNIKFKAIKRKGAQHNDFTADEKFSNATLLREKIKIGDYEYLRKYMPASSIEVLSKTEISDIQKIENAILASLRMMNRDEFKNAPDVSEGMENVIHGAVKTARSLEELYSTAKSKRYTHARIRRIILSSFLKIDKSLFKTEPPYVRILGFSGNAASLLPKDPTKPIITKVSQLDLNDRAVKNVFETECRITDIYNLSLDHIKECGSEMTAQIIKI